jgi:hypothetical protein
MSWFTDLLGRIGRVMRLEDRVSALEKKVDTLQAPSKDAREGLEYNKEMNLYHDKKTGENFCPTCLADNKKSAIQIENQSGGYRSWYCNRCKARGDNGVEIRLPPQADYSY